MKKGFTLVELLAVIAVIAILSILVLPNFVSTYNTSVEKAMKTQENQIVDATKMFIEDYCRNPVGDNTGECSSYSFNITNSDNTKKYTCLNNIQSKKYIDDINLDGVSCKGFIVYDKEDNSKNYTNYKAYIQCEDAYQTEGIENIVDSAYTQIIEKCGGYEVEQTTPTNPSTPTTPEELPDNILSNEYTANIANDNYLSTNIKRQDIEIITFKNTKDNCAINGVNCFDISKNNNYSVIAKIEDNDSNGLKELNISANGTIYASNGYALFAYMENLKNIININYLDTSNVTNMASMFRNCKSISTLDLQSFDTKKVTNMFSMFDGCNNLTSLNLSMFNTSQVIDMGQMFVDCKNITSLDLRNFNTSNVTNMASMFYNCSKLSNLNVTSFDTSKVTSMMQMFRQTAITTIDVSNFDTRNVKSMNCMFNTCRNLTSLDLSNFYTPKLTDMHAMFTNCGQLSSLNMSNFNTSNVTDMGVIFFYCTSLTILDLDNFDTSKVTNMEQMFYQDYNLTTVYVSDTFVTTSVTNSIEMFAGCSRIVGGNGTVYNNLYTDKTYARIDTSSTPGYFNLKQ